MRKSTVLLISFFFMIFILNCAAKKHEGTTTKETISAEEVSKEEIKPTTVKETDQPKEGEAVTEKKEVLTAGIGEENLNVEDASIATNVMNLTPAGVGTEFPKDTPQLFCFSKIVGSEGETAIKHIWYHNDKMAFEIELPIKSKTWRTYSNKTMGPQFAGNWRVDITAKNGKVLKSLNFEIK